MRRTVVLAVAVAATAALAAERASACSCFPQDPRRALARADGAFVGRLVSKRVAGQRAVFTFRVERRIKGTLPRTIRVDSAAHDAACGLLVGPGGRIGLFLDKVGGRWRSSLCQQIAPQALIAAAGPLPKADGRGPVALLVGGSFGPARTLALDRLGRTLGYGRGAGTTFDLDVCPGGERVLEGVSPARSTGRIRAEIRELAGLRVRGALPVSPGPGEFLNVVSCRDRAAGDVLVQISDGDGVESRLLHVRPGGPPETVYRGPASWFLDAGDRVYLVEGGRLLALDLRSRARAEVAVVPAATGALVRSPDGAWLAGVAADPYGEESAPARVVLVHLATREVRTLPVGEEDVEGEVFWLDAARLVFLPRFSLGMALTLDTSLRTLGAFEGWLVTRSAVAGETAWGIANGLLRSAGLPAGPPRVARTFFSPETYALAVVAPGGTTSPGLDAVPRAVLRCVG